MRKRFLALLIALILIGTLVACDRGAPTEKPFYNIRKIDLPMQDKAHILALARAELTDGAVDKDKERYPLIYNNEPRGVFLTLVRPHEAALTAFGLGNTIYQAIEDGAEKLKRLSRGEDFDSLKIRVDVVDESTGEKERTVDKRWKLDVSLEGIIFDTEPIAAFLPQEILDWGIIDKKNRYHHSLLKKLIKHRKLGRVLYDQLAPKQRVNYCRFNAISFMEGDDGKPLLLFRGNKLEGFKATPEKLYDAINQAGNYLKNAVEDDGKFKYRYYPQTHKYSRAYNELRHGGTVFSMAQIYQVTKDEELLASIKRALDYLDRTSLGPDPQDSKKYDWRAVVEPRQLYSKLGGAGLALLAFGTYTQVTGDMQYMDLMRDYGKFIEYMQKPDGDMRMRYWRRPEDKGRKTEPVLYYPGEAFFGMSKLYQLDNKNPRWLKVALKGIDYIADVRDVDLAARRLPHDHWLMYAIKEWYEAKPQENHLKHAGRVTDAMMGRFNYKSKYPDFVGGYFHRPQTTPAACRLEGTTAAYKLAKHLGDQQQMERLYDALLLGASFLMRNQFNEINTMFFQNPDVAIGGYMASYWNPEIQIDYVQHSTSALIAIREIMLSKQQGETESEEEALENAA